MGQKTDENENQGKNETLSVTERNGQGLMIPLRILFNAK
jgi:hypothetical protein